jgi:hypothetical protein
MIIKGFKSLNTFINEDYINLDDNPSDDGVTLGVIDTDKPDGIKTINYIKNALIKPTITAFVDDILKTKCLANEIVKTNIRGVAIGYFSGLDTDSLLKLIAKVKSGDVYNFDYSAYSTKNDLASALASTYSGILSTKDVVEFMKLSVSMSRGSMGPGETALLFLSNLSKGNKGDLTDSNKAIEVKAKRGRLEGDLFWCDVYEKLKELGIEYKELASGGLGKKNCVFLQEALAEKRTGPDGNKFLENFANAIGNNKAITISASQKYQNVLAELKSCNDSGRLMYIIAGIHLELYRMTMDFDSLLLIGTDSQTALFIDVVNNSFTSIVDSLIKDVKIEGWERSKNQMPVELK